MKTLKILAMLMMFAMLSVTASAFEPPTINGAFTRVPGQTYKFDGKSVEVIEFMSFYCGHCYAFEKSVLAIKGNFPKKIKWRIVPIYWGTGSSKPGEAYFLAEEAGKGEQMKKALFRAQFVDKKDIGSVEVLDALASDVGLGFDFSQKLRSGAKSAAAARAQEMAKVYGIDETPTLIIAGDILTSPGSVNHNMDAFRDNAIGILKGILAR